MIEENVADVVKTTTEILTITINHLLEFALSLIVFYIYTKIKPLTYENL